MSATAQAPATGPADRLALRGLRFTGHHGVFDHERRDGQEFVVDLVLAVDTTVAAASDDLGDTVDYGAVSQQVRAVVEGEPVDLIETLAQRIADAVLGHTAVDEVEVSLHKPQAPLDVRFDDVCLTITRSRATPETRS